MSWLSLAFALWLLWSGFQLPATGLLLIAAAPVLHQVYPCDNLHVPHHKVRLPRVSLAVMCGLALVLLSVAERGPVLWLSFANVAGYLLHTYWVQE